MSDLFHPEVPDEYIARVFAAMALGPRHTFQLLTKRPERMRAWLARPEAEGDVRAAAAGLAPGPARLRVGRSRTSGWARASRTPGGGRRIDELRGHAGRRPLPVL